MRFIYTYRFILIILLFNSCLKIEKYSEIPEIHFEDFQLYEATDILGNKVLKGVLRFSFVDGDGNIGTYYNGVAYRDSLWKYEYDFFLTRYNKINGVYFLDTAQNPLTGKLDTLYDHVNIPYIEKTGQNKLLMGEIIIEDDFVIIKHDTIRYEYFLVDRDDNQSNVDFTPDLLLKIVSPQ